MKLPLTFVAPLFFTFPCFAQLDTTGNPGALEHYSDYNPNSINIRKHREKTVAITIRNDSTQRVFEEYFLRDDSSYFYFHYDSAGTPTALA